MLYRILFILLLLTALFACERDNTLPDPEYFVDSELLTSYNQDEIVNLVNDMGNIPGIPALLIRYGVSIYKIIYETVDTDNNPVLASGALIVPDNKSRLPLLSFQHGTIRQDEDAPSYFVSSQYHSAVFFASTGYIMVLPDYLGYGSSSQMEHPYEHGRSLATASRDMLRAVREFDIRDNKFAAGDKLFLTGYSEGGYATMALLKLLEEEHKDEFRVTAATVGAGAYNKSEFARYILEADTELTYINYFLWVLDAYNRIYKVNRPYTTYFNEPVASAIQQGGIFANTELNPQNIFTNSFREGIINGTDTEFISILADNDNYDWKPSVPLQLYHGTDDDFVFYFNSATAWEAMTGRGSLEVELKPSPGGDHYTTVPDYYFGTFLFFSNY